MAFGSSLEPHSAEGWAASVQSEARARGRQSARSAWVVTARETLWQHASPRLQGEFAFFLSSAPRRWLHRVTYYW